MLERGQIFRCNTCGNMFELILVGGGSPTCCGSDLELLSDDPKDVGAEKHIPIIEKTDSGVKVKVGKVPHPMEEKHYIEWVEITQDGKAYRQFLKPGEAPQAVFPVQGEWTAREYCNLHGLWQA